MVKLATRESLQQAKYPLSPLLLLSFPLQPSYSPLHPWYHCPLTPGFPLPSLYWRALQGGQAGQHGSWVYIDHPFILLAFRFLLGCTIMQVLFTLIRLLKWSLLDSRLGGGVPWGHQTLVYWCTKYIAGTRSLQVLNCITGVHSALQLQVLGFITGVLCALQVLSCITGVHSTFQVLDVIAGEWKIICYNFVAGVLLAWLAWF